MIAINEWIQNATNSTDTVSVIYVSNDGTTSEHFISNETVLCIKVIETTEEVEVPQKVIKTWKHVKRVELKPQRIQIPKQRYYAGFCSRVRGRHYSIALRNSRCF